MLNVSPFEKCFLTTNSNKVRTVSIRIFSEQLGLRKYSTRGYNKTHNKLQSPVPIVLKILFSRPETKPVSFFLAFKSGTMWKFKQKGCQENKANIRFSSTSLKLESAIHKKLFKKKLPPFSCCIVIFSKDIQQAHLIGLSVHMLNFKIVHKFSLSKSWLNYPSRKEHNGLEKEFLFKPTKKESLLTTSNHVRKSQFELFMEIKQDTSHSWQVT